MGGPKGSRMTTPVLYNALEPRPYRRGGPQGPGAGKKEAPREDRGAFANVAAAKGLTRLLGTPWVQHQRGAAHALAGRTGRAVQGKHALGGGDGQQRSAVVGPHQREVALR